MSSRDITFERTSLKLCVTHVGRRNVIRRVPTGMDASCTCTRNGSDRVFSGKLELRTTAITI